MDNDDKILDEPTGFGNSLISWEVDEHVRHNRTLAWYIIVAVIGVGLIVYALLTANFLFAVIILLFGVISYLAGLRDSERVQVHITDNGALFGAAFYPYKNIKDFAIIYEPPEVKVLYLDFHSGLHPMMSIPLEDTDPNHVRECLLPYVKEDLKRKEETLTDLVSRLYKL